MLGKEFFIEHSACINYGNNTVQLKEKPKILEVTESKTEVEEKTDSSPESITVQEEKSPSRDSSKEKSKEAASLRRNKNKKKGPKVKEEKTIQNSKLKNNVKAEIQKEIKIPTKNVGAIGKIHKDNFEKHTRKRKWGSRIKKTRKKASIFTSTDFHEETIPEVKLFLLSKVQLSPNEKEKTQTSQKLARGNLNKNKIKSRQNIFQNLFQFCFKFHVY